MAARTEFFILAGVVRDAEGPADFRAQLVDVHQEAAHVGAGIFVAAAEGARQRVDGNHRQRHLEGVLVPPDDREHGVNVAVAVAQIDGTLHQDEWQVRVEVEIFSRRQQPHARSEAAFAVEVEHQPAPHLAAEARAARRDH